MDAQREARPNAFSCPSAQPGMAEVRVFGIVLGTAEAPRVAYLKRGAELDPDCLDLPREIPATRIFRHAARCEDAGCVQFGAGRCGLARRIVEGLAPVASAPPPCSIRDTCRWHAEEGSAACLRCPQIVTLVPTDRSKLADLSRPASRGGA